MIKPTVGRKVWYFNGNANQMQPIDATIVYVHSDTMVNVAGFDHNGQHYAETSVHLMQPGDQVTPSRRVEWTPYHVRQERQYNTEMPRTFGDKPDIGGGP